MRVFEYTVERMEAEAWLKNYAAFSLHLWLHSYSCTVYLLISKKEI